MRQDSIEYQQFKEFKANFVSSYWSAHERLIDLENHQKLLNNKGVILLKQSQVKQIQQAIKHIDDAAQTVESIRILLKNLDDVSIVELREILNTLDNYKGVLSEIVKKAFARRAAAMEVQNAL